MVHSGYEASSVVDSVRKPWKPLVHAIRGIKTDGAIPAEKVDRMKTLATEVVTTAQAASKK